VRGAADVVQDLATGLEAAVDQAIASQPLQRGGVVGQVFRLAPDRGLPIEPEPGQVFVDRGLERGPAALGVDILDPENEAPAELARDLGGGQG
jgi:hypothetical protein